MSTGIICITEMKILIKNKVIVRIDYGPVRNFVFGEKIPVIAEEPPADVDSLICGIM